MRRLLGRDTRPHRMSGPVLRVNPTGYCRLFILSPSLTQYSSTYVSYFGSHSLQSQSRIAVPPFSDETSLSSLRDGFYTLFRRDNFTWATGSYNCHTVAAQRPQEVVLSGQNSLARSVCGIWFSRHGHTPYLLSHSAVCIAVQA